METLGQVTVKVKFLHPEDTIGKAAEAIRCSTVGAVPVVDQGLLLGLLTAESLAEFLSVMPPPGARELSVSTLPLEGAIVLPEGLAPAEALQFLRLNHLERVMVQDGPGGLLGIVTRAELVSAVCGRVRPPIIGGMATPFGVYLAGGGVRGGVGDLALMSTGMYLAAIQLVAMVLASHLVGPGGWFYQLPVPVELLDWAAHSGLEAFQWIFFALLFKVSWFITGYHAAEHQVVHTIEAGDDLEADVVRQKPRVHPRCGTNLVAAVLIMTQFWDYRNAVEKGLPGLFPVLSLLTVVFFWRRIGGLIQQYITTSPANPKQLRSGITAAQELMDRYQQRPEPRPRLVRRIWNMGLIQVMGGSFLIVSILMLLDWLHLLPPALQGF